jgi:hypothetical protein
VKGGGEWEVELAHWALFASSLRVPLTVLLGSPIGALQYRVTDGGWAGKIYDGGACELV